MGFDIPTSAWRHLKLCTVILATGGSTENSLICHQIVITITESTHALFYAVNLSANIAVSSRATICDLLAVYSF